MASPIVIDGLTSIIIVNTKLYTGDITVQIPSGLDLDGKLITVVDTGGMASLSRRILVTPTGGAVFNTGQAYYAITKAYGSFSFSQSSSLVYVIPQTVIQGNINTGEPSILISTPHTTLTNITSQSSLVVLNDLSVQSLGLGGAIVALGGFQPTATNPYTSIDYLSAITISTGAVIVGTVNTTGGLQTSNILASSVNAGQSYNTYEADVNTRVFGTSSLISSISFNKNSFTSSNGNLFLGGIQINNDINFLVPPFYSSMAGIMSSLNSSPGLSSLSTQISLISTTYNANPGLSTLSTYNGNQVKTIAGDTTSSVSTTIANSLFSNLASPGISTLSTSISLGLSSIALPFSMSSLSSAAIIGASSIFEGNTISSLLFVLQMGLSSVNANSGIDSLTTNTKGMLSTTQQSVLMSTLSTTYGYGPSTVDINRPLSSLSTQIAYGFSLFPIANTLSSFSSILEANVVNVNSYAGLSSFSTTLGYGLSSIDLRSQVSSISSVISYGLSSISSFSLLASSMSTIIVRQISTVYDSGISSLFTILRSGASTLHAGPGISSFSTLYSTSFLNVITSPGLSTLSSVFILGISSVIIGTVPSSMITFSTLFTSSLSLQNSATTFGNILYNNGILTVNGHGITPPNNNFETASSISTYNVFVLSSFTTGQPLYPSSLRVQNALTVSTVFTTTAVAESTIVGIFDVFGNSIVNEFRATANYDLFYNGQSVFASASPGLSTLSSVISAQLSSISTFTAVQNAISTGFSTLSTNIGRICTLSSLYNYRYTPTNVSAGVSTINMYISTLLVSSLNVTNMNLWSTFVSTLNASSIEALTVSSLINNSNSGFWASTVSVGTSFVSTFAVTLQTSTISTTGLTYGYLQANNVIANSFFANYARANTFQASTFWLQDKGTSYSFKNTLEFSTFYQLNGSNGFLQYNSTIFSATLTDSLIKERVSTNIYTTSTLTAGIIYTSSVQFSGKVQFDRLTVMQSTLTPYFLATECGSNTNGASQNRLFRSLDGITWSVVTPTANCWVGRSGGNATLNNTGSYSYRLAWNGSVMIAYSVHSPSNTNEGTVGPLWNNAISYDGGLTWSNIPKYTVSNANSFDFSGGTSIINANINTILWAGEKWWKFCGNNYQGGIEPGTATSLDGINWYRYVWNLNDSNAGSNSDFFGYNGLSVSFAQPYGWGATFFNGTTMLQNNSIGQGDTSQKATTGNGAVAFSDDMINSRGLCSNALFGQTGTEFPDTALATCWSDGYGWWIFSQVGAGGDSSLGSAQTGLARVYPWRNGMSNTIQSNDANNGSAGAITWCQGVGFDFSYATIVANANASKSFNSCSVNGGCFNGHMHVCGRIFTRSFYPEGPSYNTTPALPSSQNILYSYDGIYWFANPSVKGTFGNVRNIIYGKDKWIANITGNSSGLNTNGGYTTATNDSGPSILYSYDGLNWNPAQGTTPQCATATTATTGTVLKSRYGGGCGWTMYMSNIRPSLDFNGIRIYNQPGGFSWQNPVSREQTIVAFQSSIMLHNTMYLCGDNSVSSIMAGTNFKVGICNVTFSTSMYAPISATLDLGGVATVTAERLYTSSLYILPYTSTGVASTNIFTERRYPLSSFNFYVAGSTFMSRLSLNVSTPMSILDMAPRNPLTDPYAMPPIFRVTGFGQANDDEKKLETIASAWLSNCGSSNAILGPQAMVASTGMSLFYRSGTASAVNYKRSFGGSNFFTGQHATQCLDISGALVSSITSTTTTDLSGNEVFQYSTIWTDYTGYLVSSADSGYLSIPNANLRLFGTKAINITEALPITKITTKDKDPAVFGIVTNNTNSLFNSDGTPQLDSDPLWGNDLYGRVRVNSLGEGALWVTNINGNISNGDYLCSSAIPGLSRKQDENAMYNYTVAKATMSCDFDLTTSNYVCQEITYNSTVYRRAFIGVTYHCG